VNLVVVGNHDIDLTRGIASKIAAMMVVMAEEPEFDVFGNPKLISIRAPRTLPNPASPVESMALRMAQELSLPVAWHRPLNGGRAAVYDRDYSLIEMADRVMAFFREDRLMTGGTGHVVHAALTKGIAVEAWSLSPDGSLYSVGTDDGFEVGQEGSRWMQLRYLEWQAAQVEDQLNPGWRIPDGLAWDTAKPIVTGTITVTGTTTTTLGPGKLWVSSNQTAPQF
jgi:hypothetical protein